MDYNGLEIPLGGWHREPVFARALLVNTIANQQCTQHIAINQGESVSFEAVWHNTEHACKGCREQLQFGVKDQKFACLFNKTQNTTKPAPTKPHMVPSTKQDFSKYTREETGGIAARTGQVAPGLRQSLYLTKKTLLCAPRVTPINRAWAAAKWSLGRISSAARTGAWRSTPNLAHAARPTDCADLCCTNEHAGDSSCFNYLSDTNMLCHQRDSKLWYFDWDKITNTCTDVKDCAQKCCTLNGEFDDSGEVAAMSGEHGVAQDTRWFCYLYLRYCNTWQTIRNMCPYTCRHLNDDNEIAAMNAGLQLEGTTVLPMNDDTCDALFEFWINAETPMDQPDLPYKCIGRR
eukprot:TRINITY_DN5076_c1_g1_i1.p1 TRINITY_DN5076_c1_g1~~TRINITY_DN5076_c1_g1_i1.p1  ORF type:complete len:347 (+),score=41.79 TRINITY_DN5076_c1_g1_i1:331-1371(+)